MLLRRIAVCHAGAEFARIARNIWKDSVSLATKRILIDTGPIVALLDQNDPYHDSCVKYARKMPETVYTCWPVITEACYLLRRRQDLVDRLLETDEHYDMLPAHGRRSIL